MQVSFYAFYAYWLTVNANKAAVLSQKDIDTLVLNDWLLLEECVRQREQQERDHGEQERA